MKASNQMERQRVRHPRPLESRAPHIRLGSAHWISAPEPSPIPAGERPAYEFKSSFYEPGAAAAAELTVTAHGIYEAFLNGTRVGDEELTPGFTSYGSRLYVQTFEVTGLLRPGLNTLRLVLSDGWYRGRCGASRIPDNFGTTTAIIAHLSTSHGNGESLVLETDGSWQCRVGAILAADLMDGQTTDLRREDSEPWGPVRVSDTEHSGTFVLERSPAPPVRRTRTIQPASITRLPTGRQVIDFGTNLNGWIRLRNLGPDGTTTVITHGEALDAEGDLTTEHLAYVDYPSVERLPVGQQDTVISRGNPTDEFEPRHTTHGFRYAAVDGRADDLQPEDVSAILVRSDLARTGTFRCSNPDLNQLHAITVASWQSNTCDIPTDCPQRERWGYTGDFQIFAESAAFLEDIRAFASKWLRALADDQLESGCITNVAPNCGTNPAFPVSLDGSAGWGDSATIVPWALYCAYGDRRILHDAYPMMKRWVDYAAGQAAAGRHDSRKARSLHPAPHETYLWDTGWHWGEWAEPGDVFDPLSDKSIVATAYLAHSASILARAASVLGETADAHRFAALADSVRSAWRTEFLGQDGHLTQESQANYTRALAFGLLDDAAQRATAARRLVELIHNADNHLSTGFLATPLLLPTLVETGHTDLAYTLLLQESAPGWLNMIRRGATTIWESWEGIRDDGTAHDSLNHYSKGAVIAFLHQYVAGLRPDPHHPGYAEFQVKPVPGPGITSAHAALQTAHGRITVEWHLREGRMVLDLEVPPDAAAHVHLPNGLQRSLAAGSYQIHDLTPEPASPSRQAPAGTQAQQ